MGVKTQIGTRISQTMAEEIQEIIETGRYLNTSDFLRAAARDKLEREKEEN